MIIRLSLAGAMILGAAVLWPGVRPPPAQPPNVPLQTPVTPLSRVNVACGCAAIPPDAEPIPSREEFDALLARFSTEPLSAQSHAMETLLFYGPSTDQYLTSLDSVPRDDRRSAFLQRQLRHTRARVWVRVVDQSGIVRARLGAATVPFGQK